MPEPEIIGQGPQPESVLVRLPDGQTVVMAEDIAKAGGARWPEEAAPPDVPRYATTPANVPIPRPGIESVGWRNIPSPEESATTSTGGELMSVDPSAPVPPAALMTMDPRDLAFSDVGGVTEAQRPNRLDLAEDLLNQRILLAMQNARGGGGGIPRRALAELRTLQQQAADADKAFLEAMKQQFQTEAEGLAALSNQQNQVADDLARLQMLQDEAEIARQQKAREDLAKLERMISETTKQQINPERFLGGQFSSSRITAAIAVALGAIGQAFTGGENAALQHIERMIDRDIEAQKEALSRRVAGLEARMNLYQQMLQAFRDEKAAELATKAALLQQAEIRTKALMARTDSANVIARGNTLLAQLQAQRAAAQAEFMAQRLRGAGRGARARTRELMQALKDLADFQVEASKREGEGDVVPLPGTRFVDEQSRRWFKQLGSEAITGLIRDTLNPLADLKVELERAKQLAERYGMEIASGEGIVQGRQILGMIQRSFNVLTGQGAIAEGEAEQLEEMFRDPTEVTIRRIFGSGEAEGAINQMLEITDRFLESRLRNYGLTLETDEDFRRRNRIE